MAPSFINFNHNSILTNVQILIFLNEHSISYKYRIELKDRLFVCMSLRISLYIYLR